MNQKQLKARDLAKKMSETLQILKQLFSCKSILERRNKTSAAQDDSVTKDNKGLFKIM